MVRHSTNLGKGAALKTGLSDGAAGDAQFFLFLDGDGQHDPSDIPAFFGAINDSGADLVVGNRMNGLKSMPLVRRLTNRFMPWQIGSAAIRSRRLRRRRPLTEDQIYKRQFYEDYRKSRNA